jgi:DNA polymerase-1
MLAEWLINPDSHNLGLKKLAWVRLNKEMTDIETLIGKGKQQRTMDTVQLETAAAYAIGDVDAVIQLYPILQAELNHPRLQKSSAHPEKEKPSELASLFHLVEMPLIAILAEMEMRGILLDVEFLAQMSKELTIRMQAIEDEVIHIVGSPFNLNSSQQLSHALFDILGLKYLVELRGQ